MPLPKDLLERNLAKVNQARRPDLAIKLESYEPPGRFVLSFPDRAMPEGQCIDQDFSEIQWALHENEKIDTGIQGGRKDEALGRYFIDYEVIEWD
jgi:hypothetical protein